MAQLNFVIPIRHPSTVTDTGAQLAMLDQTFRSISGQTSSNWSAWVVGNRQQRLPEMPSNFHFLPVDYEPEQSFETAVTLQDHYKSFRLDKGRRVLAAVKKISAEEVVMVVDDDDLVSSRLAEFVKHADTSRGYYIGRGYVWKDGSSTFLPTEDFHKKCGTSLLVPARAFLFHEAGRRDDDPEVISELGSHVIIVDRARRKHEPFRCLPFRGAVYRIGAANSHASSIAPLKMASALKSPLRNFIRLPLRFARSARSMVHNRNMAITPEMKVEFFGAKP